ncbi:MAG: cell division protein ZapE [Alphaproteobacteria bacterium]|nr:cell division protein ZapE [Alphaproteobacteria bacterium]
MSAGSRPLTAYQDLVRRGAWRPEPSQESAAKALDRLHDQLAESSSARAGFARRLGLSRQTEPPLGLYLHGGVGRGKSALMDLFFASAPIARKRRVHFHAFMLDVHARIHAWRKDPANKSGDGDPIKPVAKQLAGEAELLCFDEFQVSDTADAMILQRLFKKMFERGVIVVATSNRPPDDLYKNGLNRQLFLPFIEQLKTKCGVVELDGARDFRLERLQMAPVFYTPLGPVAERALVMVFQRLAGTSEVEPVTLEVQGRTLTLPRAANGVAVASFADLCERPLGAADYLAIAQSFNTLILSGIPRLPPEKRNEAKRFVTLVDALYEHKAKLVCSAEAPPEQLYAAGDGTFEFARCSSRLIEMQSTQYLALGHIG